MERITRRKILHLVVASSAVGLVPACSSGAPAVFGDVSAGNASDLAVGQIRAVGGAPCFVARDANGIYAMTTTCSHEGCDMASGVQADIIYCACHGSAFDAHGNVLRGPAAIPLEHFAVTVDPTTGEITVHGGQTVAPSVRVV